MSDETRNLEDSLDEMLGPSPDEPPAGADELSADGAPTPEPDDPPPADDAFADEVQQMLDEVGDPADQPGGDEPIDDAIDFDDIQPFDPAIDELADAMEAADDALKKVDPAGFDAPQAAEDQPGDDESKLISEIDAMLAAGAENNVDTDEFDEADEAGEAEPRPADATDEPDAAKPALDEAAAPPDDEPGESLDIEGDMQSLDELMSESEQPEPPATEAGEVDDPAAPAAMPLEAERSFESKFDEDHAFDASDFASAEDVANELDEIEGAMQSIDELDAAPAPTAESDATPPAQPQAAPEPAAEEPAEQVLATTDKPGRLIGVMAIINKPIMSQPSVVRDAVGCIAIGTLLLAALCWVNGVFGPGMAMMVAVPLMSLLPVAIFFLLIKPNRAPAAKTDDGAGDDDLPDGAAAT